MSAGGLIAQAVLGGAQAVGTGIGDRIREEAKLKRQQALAETETTEVMKRQGHAESLRRGTNEQAHGLTMEQKEAENEAARGRIELTSELSQKTYEDVTDENGNIIGQRETGSNQYSPFTTGGTNKAPWQVSARIESIQQEIKAIRGKDVPDPEDETRVRELRTMLDRLTAGETLSMKERLDREGGNDGEGGNGGGDGSGKGDPEPSSFEEAFNEYADKRGEEAQSESVTKSLDALENEAEQVLGFLKAPQLYNEGPNPYGVKSEGPSKAAIKEASAFREKAMQITPEQYQRMSPRQENALKSMIFEIDQLLRSVPESPAPKR